MTAFYCLLAALAGALIPGLIRRLSRPSPSETEQHLIDSKIKAFFDGWDNGYDDGQEDALDSVRHWAAEAQNLPECCLKNIGLATNYAEDKEDS